MRVLLAHPPLSAAREVTPPLGLCSLAAWLLPLGNEVEIVDLDLELKTARRVGSAAYLDLFSEAVERYAPDVVGVTSMYNNSLQAERLIRRLEADAPEVVAVAGGSHFGALGRQALRRIPELDYAIEGEGELAFSGLLDVLADGGSPDRVPGLCYRARGAVRCNDAGELLDLTALPPMWEAVERCLDVGRYARTIPADSARRAVYLEAGRGCPFACTFCATAPFWRRRYRVRSTEAIVDDVRYLHDEHGYDSVMLVHDLPTANRRFVSDLADAMLAARIPVEWMINHRVDLPLDGLLPKLRAAGCWKVFLGVESASERQQASITKNLTVEATTSTLRSLADQGMSATCSFVMGFPDEQAAELSATVALGAKLKLLGADIVQYHRLRTWPPAPLAGAGLPADFDLASLRIEYPFAEVDARDVAAIAGDAEFFAGYFAPHSTAGSFEELAQVELFFGQAVALVPLAVAALGRFLGEDLVPSFYAAFAGHGGIARSDLDAERFDLVSNWRVVRPLLRAWLTAAPLEPWQRALLGATVEYEERRLHFATGSDAGSQVGLAATGRDWIAFAAGVDVPGLVEAIVADADVTAELATPYLYVLARRNGDFDAYRLAPELERRLRLRDPELVAPFGDET